MGFFDDIKKVVETVIQNPIAVIVPTFAGGAVLGPAGAALGAAAGAANAIEQQNAEALLKTYRDQLNGAIAEVKAAVADYTALPLLWIQFNAEAFDAAYKQRYGVACPLPDVLAPMIALDIDLRRKSLSDATYKAELDGIHNTSVSAAVAQLEHERDNPDDRDKPPANTGEMFGRVLSGILTTAIQIAAYLSGRFMSNFEGASNESGFGAKILRGGTGISFEDIKARGLLGGDNSYLRKIIPTWSDGGGVFGGSESFFRKPFG